MKEKITLYNHFHNGDIFFSRVIINLLSEKFNIDYYHNLSPTLLCDIENLNEFNGVPTTYSLHGTSPENHIVNTWIGQQGMIFVSFVHKGCSFENYLEMCKRICNFYGITIGEDENILPSINYSKIPNISSIITSTDELISKYQKVILISNGDVHSAQSYNFSFNNIINRLSSEFPKILFLITEPIPTVNTNIVSTNNLTQVRPDLLQISYISTKCDVIVGRASGPYCFSQVKENLLNPNKTFISFCNTYNEGKYYDNQKSKFIWSNDYNEENMYNTIKQTLIN